MKDQKPEVILREDGFYQITLLYGKERIDNLINDSYGHRDNLAQMVTNVFAEKYVEKNFSELSKLIDLDLVKLLATRKLAGIVAST